ncbi:MAG: UTP:GlnB [Actinomycetia bacterium]|nr:UTP:GlnB [Actinomycetes bacterium]
MSATSATPATSPLREQRSALVADTSLRGARFGRALAQSIDDTLRPIVDAFETATPIALVALGSYGRGELCPGSDVDVALLVGGRRNEPDEKTRELAERCWYPLWDAGFVTGHGTRTIRQFVALAADDLDALTSIVHVRLVAGDASLAEELQQRGRQLAEKRRDRVLHALADASGYRRTKPGPVAEMLEPDVKDGAGGLRDVESLGWAGHTLGAPGGIETLESRGFLTADDVSRFTAAHDQLLDVRVAVHRVSGGRTDRLALQDQDAVATLVEIGSADELVRSLSTTAREVAWIARDTWTRLQDFSTGPRGRVAHRDRVLAERVVLRDGRVTIVGDGPVGALDGLEAAAVAGEVDAPFDRVSLVRLQTMEVPTWDVWQRAAFLRLLRTGEHAIPVFEALDHEDVLTRVLPEWEHVRSRPQRNAYHRFTVDRHSLEAVAECARLLDLADADAEPLEFDGMVARSCRRPELLLLAALLHDIGKGRPGDHAQVGAETAATVARRIGLDSEGREVLTWLVRDHLLLAEVATRRDLSDAAVIDGVAAACAGDPERLRLLYLLTVGDSRATGPAAWGIAKAALLRDLFLKTATAIDHGAAVALAEERRAALATRLGEAEAADFLAVVPPSYLLAFDDETMARHYALLRRRETQVVAELGPDGRIVATVVAPDRNGLLATLAGALTCAGLTVTEANLFSTTHGMALDVFRASDPYGRFERHGADRVRDMIEAALSGSLDVAAGVAARVRSYRRPDDVRGNGQDDGEVQVAIDASSTATVFEVHAPDDVGLLYRLAITLAGLNLDVSVAKVATMGARVVDVFYVRDATGERLTDSAALDEVRARLRRTISE